LSSKKLYAYGSDKPLTVAGSFIADVRVKDKCVSAEFRFYNVQIHKLIEFPIQLLSQMIRNTPDWLYHRFYSFINWNPKLKILQFVAGSFIADVRVKDKCVSAEFFVVEEEGQTLLGHRTATELGIFKITVAADIEHVNTVTSNNLYTYISIFLGYDNNW
jgi:hypothetical protein